MIDVHLELETGMNRVGIAPENALEFADYIRNASNLKLTGLMTHFAVADEPESDAFTARQLRLFEDTLGMLEADGHQFEFIHVANTAAAWRFPNARHTHVRLGLGLYGLFPSSSVPVQALKTQEALRFRTRVIQVKTISEHDSVSYGRTWVAEGPRTIATIAVGYNDGFPRFMSNGGEVLIHGQRCPVVGKVCMDVTMVDVSHLEDVREADEVVLFGNQGDGYISVNELATRGNTISYEILCNISARVQRVFERSN